MIDVPLKNGPWKKADLADVPKHGKTVLSTFSCGGGSSFGYKLAGFEVVGCVEIDAKIFQTYLKNHHVRHPLNMSIQDFNQLTDKEIPDEFWNLDILDGSPPCSTFSMAGAREKKWGKAHHFREGQAKQNLDELFFDFIATAKRLQPKVVVAENVKGLIQGNARGYVKQIFKGFRDAGYTCQLFLLNASAMGVPQRRERTFFIANRLGKKIKLEFDEKPIPLRIAFEGAETKTYHNLTENTLNLWRKCKPGKPLSTVHPKKMRWNCIKLAPNDCANTLCSSDKPMHWEEPRTLSNGEMIRIQTYPDDYDAADIRYVCGMSVPPFMMQRIAKQIYEQLLDG